MLDTGDESSSSEGDEELSDDPSTWKLSAYTKQKARKRRPAEGNVIASSIAESGESDSQEAHSSSSYEEGDGVSVSESSEVGGAAGFLEDEAMDVSFSSELEEMENEGSGESEVDGEEGEEEEESESRGFILDEAAEEEPYQARKRRRRQVISSSSSSDSLSSDGGSEQRDRQDDKTAKDEEESNLNLNLKLRKSTKVVQTADISSKSETARIVENGERVNGCGEGSGKEESSDLEENAEESDNSAEIDDRTSSNESSDDNGAEHTSESSSGEGEEEGESEDEGEEESNDDSGDKEVSTPSNLKWKRDLLSKAREAYNMRNKRSTSLRKLVYSDLPLDHGDKEGQKEEDEEKGGDDELGGLFQLAKKKEALSMNHRDDTSLPPSRGPLALSCDWSDATIAPTVKNLFVTGSWGDEDAQAVLEEDEEMYGDFEDLETGERHREKESKKDDASRGEEEGKRLKKKKNLKAAFDVDYDDQEGGEGGYLEDLKREVSEQERRNRAEFEGLDEQTRVQYEGFRPGTYVRMELKGEILTTTDRCL